MNVNSKKIFAISLLVSIIFYSLPVAAFTKDETVYSNAKSSGEKYKTIVTTHLENTEEEEILRDLTDLINIENTAGEETFERNGETLIWDANKKDIYYKGETSKDLPIDMEIQYMLNGEIIEPDKIAGKTGDVTVNINFKNNQSAKKAVNGKYETLYVPFMVACGTYIGNENNKQIEIDNGKLIDDGTKTFAASIVFPGMQESLNLKKEFYEIPESVTIKMKSENFEMNNIICVFTPLKFDDVNTDLFKKLNKVYSKVDELRNASTQIEEGAKSLADGTSTYYEKSKEFNSAIEQFAKGVNTASASYSELNLGITTIDNGSKELQSGSKQLSSGTSTVDKGANTMKNQVKAFSNKVPELTEGAGQVYGGLDALYNGLVAKSETEDTQTKEKLTGLVTQEKVQAGTIKAHNQSLSTAKSQLSAIDLSKLDEEEANAIETAISAIDAQINANNNAEAVLNENADGYVSLVQDIGNTSKEELQGLAQNVKTLKDGAKLVSDGTMVVQSGMTELNSGLDTLTKGTNQLSDGANSLYTGTTKLSAGTSQLKNGSSKMQSGLQTLDINAKAILNADTQLTEGAKTIQDGADQLSAGVEEFNKSGINKICNYINGDIRNLTDRMQVLRELANEYKTFTKTDIDTQSSVKFITIIDSIKNKDDSNNGQEKIDEKPAS